MTHVLWRRARCNLMYTVCVVLSRVAMARSSLSCFRLITRQVMKYKSNLFDPFCFRFFVMNRPGHDSKGGTCTWKIYVNIDQPSFTA